MEPQVIRHLGFFLLSHDITGPACSRI